MKTTLKLIGIFGLILALPLMVFAGDLSENFNDSTLTDWGTHGEASGWTTYSIDTTGGNNGTAAMKLDDGGWGFLAKRPITATIGTKFKMTILIKTNAIDDGQIFVNVEDIDGSDTKVAIFDTNYTTITIVGTAVNDSGYIRIAGSSAGGACEVWVDDVNFDDNTDTWIDISEARAHADGDTVTIQGIVTATEMGVLFYMQDDSAGMTIYDSGTYSAVTPGDRVLLTGDLMTYHGLRELSHISSYTIINSGLELPTPKEITADELDGEKYEAELVKVRNVSLVSGTWPSEGSSTNLTANDGSSDFTFRVDSDTDVDGSNEPKWPLVSLTGIVCDYDGAQIIPRKIEDIEELNIRINEFLAENDATIADTSGDFADYIEIINLGSGATDIGGMFITDDLTDPTMWQIPTSDPTATTIPAGGYIKLWADKDTLEGILHVHVKLSGDGEQIGLYRSDTTVIDTLSFGAQATDISYGRLPNGNDNWEFMPPTPGYTNMEWPADLMFSEYVEGSGQNKALEVYNPRTDTVNLGNYIIKGSHNGDNDWNYATFDFPSVELAPGEVYVLATTDADSAMKAKADTLMAYGTNKIVYFNGNDARALYYSIIQLDVIGKPDEDIYWDVAGVSGATAEYTLIRKSTVTSGNTDWASSAGTDKGDSEWEIMPQDMFLYLGSHPHTDFTAPFVEGEVSEDALIQIRFNEEVDSAQALDVANYTVDGTTPTSVTKLNDVVYTLDAGTMTPNTDVQVIVSNITDMIGLNTASDTIITQYLTMDTTASADNYLCEWETELGLGWWAPTGSGSTYGIDGSSSFSMSSDFAYEGTQSAKLDIVDDAGTSGGWFVREYNATQDLVPADSKYYLYLKANTPDVQVRIVIDDEGTGGDGGYEVSRWFDITATGDDWQVISLDLANDPVYGWVNGDGVIGSTDNVEFSSLQFQCKKDVDAVIYMDILTERPAGTNAVTSSNLPEKFALHQNYPNPFNPTTNIKFDLPNAMDVQLVIYDIMGRKITTLVNNHMEAGYKNVVWNGTNDFGSRVSSGIYIYRVIAGQNIKTMKMSYIK
ncbi:MAG: lamin tail domain-containing protein [Candidatus Marinimicrobia bacterium]|nr:lamin tail domain-containing protein [Candidatus Neomarinimicrobiota bacterium]